MHQIRHILDACLILLMIIMGAFLYSTFPESDIIGKSPATDNDSSNEAQILTKGKRLFQQNCGSCHSLNKELAAPALDGLINRGPWSERENLIKWIKDPSVFIPTTKYTTDLQKRYNGMIMPSFGHLTDDEIKEIIDYIINDQQHSMPVAITSVDR